MLYIIWKSDIAVHSSSTQLLIFPSAMTVAVFVIDRFTAEASLSQLEWKALLQIRGSRGGSSSIMDVIVSKPQLIYHSNLE